MSEGVTRDDLRAAVASGVIDEAQAVKLQTLSDQRMGFRANMVGDDEPFELFKGFAEIFVTVGLGLLMAGFAALSGLLGGFAIIPVAMMGFAVGLAFYFTKQRRMTLPSITLCGAFAFGLMLFCSSVFGETLTAEVYLGAIGLIAMAFYFRVFRLPFAMFVFGLFGLVFISSIVSIFAPLSLSDTPYVNQTILRQTGFLANFDLRNSPYTAIGTLIFGIIAFVGGLYFDMKDPHRVSRHASTAFWLHILAAPALVNTLVLANYETGGVGTVIAIVILTIFTLLAIIIDRRSFLTAGLIYMGLIISQAIQSTNADWATIITMLVLGVFVTTLGAFWTQARAAIMGTLPDFPGKDRLPPYAGGLAVSE